MKKTNKICTKRDNRKKQTAEDFTPAWLVNQMLDKLNEYGPESWEEGKTFLDPACGNGNMLYCVLKRKLDLGHDPLNAISTIYGTDIMKDNISECRKRLLKLLIKSGVAITIDHLKAVRNNIVVCPLSRYPNGSLDYDFNFHCQVSNETLQNALDKINEGLLDPFVDPFDIIQNNKQKSKTKQKKLEPVAFSEEDWEEMEKDIT